MADNIKKPSLEEVYQIKPTDVHVDEEGKKIIKAELSRRNNMNKKENTEECDVIVEKSIKSRLYYFFIMC